MRLDKFLAESGVAPRKKNRILIKEGRVMVNGEIITEPAMILKESDIVLFD